METPIGFTSYGELQELLKEKGFTVEYSYLIKILGELESYELISRDRGYDMDLLIKLTQKGIDAFRDHKTFHSYLEHLEEKKELEKAMTASSIKSNKANVLNSGLSLIAIAISVLTFLNSGNKDDLLMAKIMKLETQINTINERTKQEFTKKHDTISVIRKK